MFDIVLLVALVLVAVPAGFAVCLTGYFVVMVLPLAGVILSLIAVGVSRHRPYLIALSALTALNLRCIVAVASSGAWRHEIIGTLELFALGWVLPLGFGFCAIEGGIRQQDGEAFSV